MGNGLHEMNLIAHYCGRFEFITFLREFTEGLCWKHRKYKECLVSGLMGNELESVEQKNHPGTVLVYVICLYCDLIHFPWTQKKGTHFLCALFNTLVQFKSYVCISPPQINGVFFHFPFVCLAILKLSEIYIWNYWIFTELFLGTAYEDAQ